MEATVNGWIYVLMCDGWPNVYKIGRTIRLSKRIMQLKIQLPMPVKLKMIIPAPAPAEFEALIHKGFSKYRLNGEWFCIDDEGMEVLNAVANRGFASCPDSLMEEAHYFLRDLSPSLDATGVFDKSGGTPILIEQEV